jgi:hypothetical protein
VDLAEIGSEKDSLYDSNVYGSCSARSVDFGVRHGEHLETNSECVRWIGKFSRSHTEYDFLASEPSQVGKH